MAEEDTAAGPVDAGAATIITEGELIASFYGPALHTNKMIASNLSAGIRITFMEQFGEKVTAQFRTAVLLSYPDALALRNLLTRQLREIEPQILATEAQAKAAEAKASDHGK
jgi:hypothetical protein